MPLTLMMSVLTLTVRIWARDIPYPCFFSAIFHSIIMRIIYSYVYIQLLILLNIR